MKSLLPKLLCLALASNNLIEAKDKSTQTYKNAKYDIEFEYPRSWFVTWEGDWQTKPGVKDTHVIDISRYKKPEPIESGLIRIVIAPQPLEIQRVLENFRKSPYAGNHPKTIKIDHIDAWRMKNLVIFIHKGRDYQIYSTVSESIFNAFLDSIKLIK